MLDQIDALDPRMKNTKTVPPITTDLDSEKTMIPNRSRSSTNRFKGSISKENHYLPHATPPAPITKGKIIGTPLLSVVVVVIVVGAVKLVNAVKVVGANYKSLRRTSCEVRWTHGTNNH